MSKLERSNLLERPISPFNIAWFEFLLDDTLLEKHLAKDNAEPSATELVSLFLFQAELASATAKEINHKETESDVDGDHSNGEITKAENGETKKVKALRLLALKAASFLNWNLDLLENVPVAIVQAILYELLKVTLGSDPPDPRQFAHMDLANLSPEVLFSVLLYHRWCLRTAVKESFPVRLSKVPNVQVPGLLDPSITSASMKDSILNTIMHWLDDSVTVLEHYLENIQDALMPSIQSISSVQDAGETHDWSKGINVSYREMACQVHFDLGCLYFYRQQYAKADMSFHQTYQIFSSLRDPVFCAIDTARLQGYCSACSGILGTPLVTSQEPTLAERLEQAKANNSKVILDLLMEDNERQELSVNYRVTVEDDLARMCRDSDLVERVQACNMVRKAVDGRLVCSGFVQKLSQNQSLYEYLLWISGELGHAKVLSFPQKNNLKHFIRYLCHTTSSSTAQKVISQKSKAIHSLFTGAEMEALKTAVGWRASQEELNINNSLPPPLEDNQITGELERQLLVSYDPTDIKQLVQKLSTKITSSQLVYLSQKWMIPRDVSQLIENLPLPQRSVPLYVHVLVAKARICIQLQMYMKSWELYKTADSIVKDVSYKLSKYLRWEILRCEANWYQCGGTPPPDTAVDDIAKRAKQCLAANSQHDMQPNIDVIQSCVAFLLNIKEWDYLSGIPSFRNGFMEISSLIAKLAKELNIGPGVARKQARELWEAVALVYTSSVQQKRTGGGNTTTIQRETNMGMLPQASFINFICKLREPVIVSALLSLLCKLYNILKDDITVEIHSDYLTLWPTTLGNVSSLNTSGIAESVALFMEYVMTVDPCQTSWLRTQADLYYAHSQYSEAMRYYLEVGSAKTNFFMQPVTKDVYDESVFKRMVKCCSYLQCHTQVAVLCQFSEEIDYATAFRALQERNVHDAMDVYYDCIWDVTMLEYLINIHAKRGDHEMKQYCIKLIGQMELNSSNPEKILQEAAHLRKSKFLQAMAKQYL